MPYFKSPKILFGDGMLRRVVAELEGKGNRAVLITDKKMVKHSDQIAEVVKSAGYEVKVWDGAEPEPAIEVAVAGSKVLSDFEPQLVVGFGGGSAIDTAKAAWMFYERPDLVATEIEKSVGVKTKLELRKKARFMAVPTTSGTGSEATWAAVLTNLAEQRKIGFANNEIVPDLALLVPEFTVGMPRELTAGSGMDALGHALESYTCRQQNDFSDPLCLQAMKLVFDWLARACESPDDLIARAKMQNAAALAGLAISNSGTAIGHALAHTVGSTFHMSHGQAVGIALPYWLEYVSSVPHIPNVADPVEKLGTAARFVGIEAKSGQEAVDKLIGKIKELAREIGQPLNLKETGVTEEAMGEKMDTLVLLASKDVSLLASPCQCQEENLKQLFQDMWRGGGLAGDC